MNCIARDNKGAELLTEYCAGALDPVQAAAIEEHARECGECRSLVEAQRSLWASLDAWKPVEVSSNFDARLYARIAEMQPERWFSEAWWSRMWKPALSIAAVAAMAVLLLVGRNETKVVPDVPAGDAKTAQTQKIDLQEVQQALDDLDVLTPASTGLTPASAAPSPL